MKLLLMIERDEEDDEEGEEEARKERFSGSEAFSRKNTRVNFIARVNTCSEMVRFPIVRNYTDYPWWACMSSHFEHKLLAITDTSLHR